MSKSITVLGAGPGLGRAVAKRYARGGYRVVLVARRQQALDGLVAELAAEGADAAAVAGDLSDRTGVAELAASIRTVGGDPDALYYGPTPSSPVSFDPGRPVRPSELTPEVVDAYFPAALHGLIGLVREFLPSMVERGDGAVLAAGGFSAVRGVPYFSAPGPALAAQRNYLQSLETELAGTGVFVGRLYVGATIANSAWHQHLQEQQAAGRPLRGGDAVVDPAELADTLWTMHHESRQAEVVVPPALLAS